MKLRKKDKRSSAKKSLSKLKTVLDNSGQFGTVLDKMLCYNGRVKDDGSDLSFGDEPFARSTVFRWVPNSPSCIECLLRPREACSLLSGANRLLKVGARCRTMPMSIRAIM